MDKLIESFTDLIDGAREVELRCETGTTGVPRINVTAVRWECEWNMSIGPYMPECRLGFAEPAEAADALARMRKTLDERGYRKDCTACSIDEFNHHWAHEYYSYQD